MESFGYDMEVITKAHPDMYCVSCAKLMREPVQFECTHGICRPCYQRIHQTAVKSGKIAQCPHCNKVIDENKVNSNDMLHRMILTVRVKCSNSMYGCYWIGRIGDLKDHYEDCRHLIPSYNRRNWRNKVKEEKTQDRSKLTDCPYFPYGCVSKELTEKELKKHLASNSRYHLKICTEFINKTHEYTHIESHQKYMSDTIDNIFSVLKDVNKMVSKFEEAKESNMDVVRNVVVRPLLPFHELFDHVKEPEKYMPRVDAFVNSVSDYVKKFDKKAFLELSCPCVADDIYTANDYQCRKISVADMFRFDMERLTDSYDKIAKKLKGLKKVHYICFVRARDVVKKVERRQNVNLNLLLTKEERRYDEQQPDDDVITTENDADGEDGDEGDADEDGIYRMQKSFDNKVDSMIKIMDDAVGSIKASYREALHTYIADPEKGHNYKDYYVWKVDASRLKTNGEATSYYKKDGTKKEKGDCLTVWSTTDHTWEGNSTLTGGLILVKYFVQTNKSDILARVFCFNQNELDRVAPCQLTVSKVLDEVETSTFSITAEFPTDLLKDGCCLNDVMYFNTVVT